MRDPAGAGDFSWQPRDYAVCRCASGRNFCEPMRSDRAELAKRVRVLNRVRTYLCNAKIRGPSSDVDVGCADFLRDSIFSVSALAFCLSFLIHVQGLSGWVVEGEGAGEVGYRPYRLVPFRHCPPFCRSMILLPSLTLRRISFL